MPATNFLQVARMTRVTYDLARGRRLPVTAALFAAVALAACDRVTDPLLEFRDPDIIDPADVRTPEGADALRQGAFGRLHTMTSGGESVVLLGGLLGDEFRSGDTFIQRNETDQRSIDTTNSFMVTAARQLFRTHVLANFALKALREFKPTPRDLQGQMFFVRGFAENMAAESFCSGIPFSDASQEPVVYGEALTTEEVLVKAQESADSAITNLPDTVRFRQAAQVLKARVLLNRAQYDSARIVASAVPLAHQYSTVHTTKGPNQIWALNNSIRRYVVADNEGTNGLPFVSANDPRLPTRISSSPDSTRDFEGRTGMVFNLKYPAETSPVVMTSGLEAKLIIAEALLAAGNATWLDTLNALRARPPAYTNVTNPLPPLADPGTANGRVDLLFRERAFWMWGTGHRLGDMRRLIRQYRRPQNTVFPIGTFKNGGPYGTDVTLPITAAERNNPKYTAVCVKSQA